MENFRIFSQMFLKEPLSLFLVKFHDVYFRFRFLIAIFWGSPLRKNNKRAAILRNEMLEK